jgi:two-component system chemotaxis response regulator CheB
VVDDLVLVQKLLTKILDEDPELTVVGVANNGEIAVGMTRELEPDVITMGIGMPVMDGFQATSIIMAENPAPILVVSSTYRDRDLQISFNAIQAGALDLMEKPKGSLSRDYYKVSEELVRKIKRIPLKYRSVPARDEQMLERTGEMAVVIGASTGGPSALFHLITSLGWDFPPPILVTLHISEGFGRGCVEWINRNSDNPSGRPGTERR